MNDTLFNHLSELEMSIFAIQSAVGLLTDTDHPAQREYLIDNLHRHATELNAHFKTIFDHLAKGNLR